MDLFREKLCAQSVIKHYILKALAVLNMKSFYPYLCTRMHFLLDYFEMVYFVKMCTIMFETKKAKRLLTSFYFKAFRYVFNHSLKYISISPIYIFVDEIIKILHTLARDHEAT